MGGPRRAPRMKLAVVGTGVMGRNHARAARELGILGAVFDLDGKAARDVAAQHGVRAHDSLDALARDGDVDAVVIATPTATHHPTAVRLLEAGKHVLVEKPIAGTVEEGRDLAARAKKAGRVLAVGHIERHNPVVLFTREALARGDFGDLITLSSRRVSNLPGRIRDVGCILDIGIHDVDVLRYVAGSEVERVYTSAGTFTKGIAFEDHASIILEFGSGVTGMLEVNWLTPMKVRQFSLTASKAYVNVDYIDQRAVISSSSFGALDPANLYQVPLELNQRVVALRKQEPLKLELEDFVRAAKTGERPLVDASDGVAALAIAEAAVASAKKRAPVTPG